MEIKLAEPIFDSIQGEGIHAGIPMSFIRLAGCNLHCIWCDTKYARTTEKSLKIPIRDITPACRWICITGGEPLVQQDELCSLILNIRRLSKKIEIETNGSIDPPSWAFFKIMDGDEVFDLVDSWVVDIKLASSGNPSDETTIYPWVNGMRSTDQIKFVVGDTTDLAEMEQWLMGLPRLRSTVPVIVSPVMPTTKKWMSQVAEFCIQHNLRLSLQLHKIIWGNRRMR